jgi:hypothetical protein
MSAISGRTLMLEDLVIESITAQVRDELVMAADNDRRRRAARVKPKPVSQKLVGAIGLAMTHARRHASSARVERQRLRPEG